ncbi:MAG: ATP-binding protein [Sulfuricurvum sp.]|nr:ATP-binding protein [Sulfuricurvum sp.]
MTQEPYAEVTKESIKQNLRGKDLRCRYYEAIVNTTTDLIAITDGKRIIDANKSLSDFCDSICVDITDKAFSFASLFEPIQKFGYIYDGYQNRSWVENVLKGEKSDCRVGIMKEGTLSTFNLTLRSLEFFQNIYVMTLTDVTEMMGYKSALEEGIKSSVKDRDKTQFLLRQYDKAIEAATLVFKCDPEGIITFANRALSETFLYAYGELTGKHFSILRGKSITDAIHMAIWERVKAGKIYRGFLELSDKLGGSRYLDASLIPIINQEGEIIEFFSLSHEITEVMEAKEAAIKTLETKNKFFDQVSHELRTPLNAIINFTDSALESFDDIFIDDESRDLVRMYIERSHKNSQHLLKLINSLLDMAKLRSGKERYEIVTTDVVSLVRDVYEATSGLNTKRELDYLLDVPKMVIAVECDVLRLRQIVTNLLSNALKFTNEGHVCIRVRLMPSACWIEIEDTGAGIPEDKLAAIFEPFEQVSAHDLGTGLGLGIVNEYAKGMGMELEVVSTLGQGSCFTLKVPIENKINEDI